MERAFLVAVRFHEGRYHGAGGWPPAPARLFQALMAGAARGKKVARATLDALYWLERLPPPTIVAPRGEPGQGYASFVPNNDLDAALSGKGARDISDAVASIRVGKTIRPILFDADAPLHYCWFFDDDDGRATALCDTAACLYQLGRGIDMAWADAAVLDANEARQRLSERGGIVHRPSLGGGAGRNLLCPQPGTGRSLEARFDGMRNRFRTGGSNRKPARVFVQPSKPLLASVAYDAPPDRIVFSLREGNARAGFAPRRLREAAALVAETRDRAAERLCDAAPAQAENVTRYLIGRSATEADKAARVRIVPIPSIGHVHADMSLRRLAIYVPQSCPLRTDDIAWAFAQVAWTDSDGVVVSELQRADDDEHMAERYENTGRRWRSVTPLVLAAARRRVDPPRKSHEAKVAAKRAREESRAVRAVHQALRHADVRVSPAAVRAQREPFDSHGERAELFAAETRFPKETLWHAEIVLAEPVVGPLLLGDGRYLGLGLMLSDEPAPAALAFSISGGLDEAADAFSVARAARRAMLARVLNGTERNDALALYLSGHKADGSPARDGSHRHIAVVADLPRQRILFVAPTLLQRQDAHGQRIEKEHSATIRALEGMDVLRAGKAGRLALAPAAVDFDEDPLFTPARVWESVTDYDVTRHRRRMSHSDALKADVAAELRRCGWPVPPASALEVVAVRRGPRGGLSGRLRIAFAAAQRGPLMLGRTAHKGGGLFAARRTT